MTTYNRIYPYSGDSLNAITVGASGYSVDFNGQTSCVSAFGYDTGRLYFEVTIDAIGSGITIGVGDLGLALEAEPGASGNNAYGYRNTGHKYNNGSASAYGATYTTNDVIGVAVDVYGGKVYFAKNGVWQDSGDPVAGTGYAFNGLSGTFYAFAYGVTSSTGVTFAFDTADFTYSLPALYRPMDDGSEFYTYAVRNYATYPEADCGSWYQYPSNTLNTSYGRMGGHDIANGSTYSYFEKTGPLYVNSDYEIIEASMNFDGENSSTVVCNLRLYFNADVTPTSPTNYTEAAALSLTTLYTDWSGVSPFSADVAIASPDMASVLQEVIGLSGWANGNEVMFIAKDNGSTGDANRFFDAIRQVVSGKGISNQNHILVKCAPTSISSGVCRWDPQAYDGQDDRRTTLTNQNRTVETYANNAAYRSATIGTIGKKYGKYYFEVVIDVTNAGAAVSQGVGVATALCDLGGNVQDPDSWLYAGDGDFYHDSPTGTVYGDTFGSAGEVIGVAVNLYTRSIWFSKDGVWQNSGSPVTGTNPAATDIATGYAVFPFVHGLPTHKFTINITSDEFLYTPPTGYDTWEADNGINYIYASKGYDGVGYTYDYGFQFIHGGSFTLPSTVLGVGKVLSGASTYSSGWLVPNVYIPEGHEILNMHFLGNVGSVNDASQDLLCKITFDKDVTPALPTSEADFNSKTKTTPVRFKTDIPTGANPIDGYAQADIKQAFRELYVDTDWQYGQQVGMFLQDDSSVAGAQRGFYTSFTTGALDKSSLYARYRSAITYDSQYAHINESIQKYKESFDLHTNSYTATSNRDSVGIYGDTGKSSGQFYFEAKIVTFGGSNDVTVGVKDLPNTVIDTAPGSEATVDGWGFDSTGDKLCRGAAGVALGSSWGAGTTIGVAVDIDNAKIWFALDGTWQGGGNPAAGTNAACTSVQGHLFPCVFFDDAGGEVEFHFKPTNFTYTPPIGFSHLKDATGSFFTVAVPELWATTHPIDVTPQFMWEDTGDITRDSTLYMGRAAGSIAQKVGLYFPHIYADDAPIVSCVLTVTAASSLSTTTCNLKLAFANDADPIMPHTYITAEGITSTVNETDWDNVPAFINATQYDSPDIQGSLSNVLGLSGWSYGNPALLGITDNLSDDAARRQISNQTDITSLTTVNYLLIEQTYGSVDHLVGFVDQFTVQDAVDGEIEWDVLVSDQVGLQDGETDAPYPAYGSPVDNILMGDLVDADHLVGVAADTLTLGDLVDADVLDGHSQDALEVADVVDAFILSARANDNLSVDDVTDALVESVFNLGSYKFELEVDGGDITITKLAPEISVTGNIPVPSVTSQHWGMVVSGDVPTPVGAANLYTDNVVSVTGNIPAPIGSANLYVEVEITSSNFIPAPIANINLYSDNVVRIAAGIPVPAATVTMGVEPNVTVAAQVPVPFGRAILSLSRTFGTLKHTRC